MIIQTLHALLKPSLPDVHATRFKALIAALIVFALWIVGINLKGSEVERHIKVNSGPKSPYLMIFLGRIACRYVVFELPPDYLELAQALLVGYFEKLEVG